jgi:hypothetical protein
MNESLKKLRIDRSRVKVIENFDDSEEIEFWRNTSYEERLEHLYRLRYMAYGDKIRGRISRVIEVVESK